MQIPGFTAEACIRHPMTVRGRQTRGDAMRVSLEDASVRPQQGDCVDFTCWDGSPSVGVYPDCVCPPPDPEPPERTCADEALCPPGLVSSGTWPDCGCILPDIPQPPPGSGGGSDPFGVPFNPGLGGVATCNQFFQCPPQWEMAQNEITGECMCK